jgi:hypothetical protein
LVFAHVKKEPDMAEPAAKTPPNNPAKFPERRTFKYPSEDETFVRRIGSAALTHWSSLPADTRANILAEAALVWDREYNTPQLSAKLEAFVRRHPGRLS